MMKVIKHFVSFHMKIKTLLALLSRRIIVFFRGNTVINLVT